jgi:hypothetical protein
MRTEFNRNDRRITLTIAVFGAAPFLSVIPTEARPSAASKRERRDPYRTTHFWSNVFKRLIMQNFLPISGARLTIVDCFVLAMLFAGTLSANAQTADPINGTVTYVGTEACSPGGVGSGTCYSLNVQCSGIDGSGIGAIPVTLKVNNQGSSKGTIIFTATGGSKTWFEGQFAYGPMLLNSVINAGFTVVQIKFGGSNGYLTGPAPDGTRALACRYAAIANWANSSTNPLIHPANTAYCAAGVSGGSSAIGYALAHFGQGTGDTKIFDMAEIVSGPTFSRFDHGCICDQPPINTHTTEGFLSECLLTATTLIDSTYSAPICTLSSKNHDPTYETLLHHDSIMSDDPPILNYATDVHVVFGGQDQSVGAPQGVDWTNAVTSPVTIVTVVDAAHFVPDSFAGAVQVANDLINSCKIQVTNRR